MPDRIVCVCVESGVSRDGVKIFYKTKKKEQEVKWISFLNKKKKLWIH